MSRTILTVTILLLSLGSSRAIAQTLGDVAKKEGERRQGVKPSGKVLTNRDLPSVPPPSATPPVTSDASPPAASGAPAAGDQAKADHKDGDKGGGAPGPKDEKYWTDRVSKLREEQQRDRIFEDSLQSRINALTTDFVNRDDPAQRDQISKDRQAAVDELARVRKSIVDRTKAIADLEDEARRAGVPAGWLR